MARPSYPSDDARRKMRPHVKVHLTVASHPRTAAVWSDLEMRAMLVELWRIAYEAFAGRTGGRVALSPAAVHSITGRERHFTGVARLRTLCSRLDYECVTDGSATFVTIRNFAIKQDPGSAARGVTPPTPDPSYSASTSDTDIHKELREEPAPAETAPAAPPPTARVKRTREPKPIPPEAAQFAADFLDGLRARHEGFQGPPTLAGWERDARLMLEVRPLDEARDLARWLFEDPGRDAEFWRRNILGVPKFREQYDRLLVLRRGASYAASDHIRPGPLTQALRNIAARANRQCN